MRDFLKLILLLGIAFVAVYTLPFGINRLIFLALMVYFFFLERKDYIWILFFLILEDQPGGLFNGSSGSDSMRLPFYSIAAGVSFTITELFLIIFLLKVIIRRKSNNYQMINYFKREYSILAILFVILVFISFLLGIDKESLAIIIKTAVGLTVFYSFVLSNNTWKPLNGFFKLCFPLAFVAILLQVYILITGEYFVIQFKPDSRIVHGSMNIAEALLASDAYVRPIEIPHILFLSFIGSLLYLAKKDTPFSKNYLIIVNSISFFSILLTGTRGWFVGFVAGYVVFFALGSQGNRSRFMRTLVVGGGLLIAMVLLSPRIGQQFDNAWRRIATVGQIVQEGGMQETSARARYSEKAPRVMEGFRKSTIVLGAGFSTVFTQYGDSHVGYHNLLLNTGIIGIIVFFVGLLRIMIKPAYGLPAVLSKNLKYYPERFVGIITFTILLVINSGVQVIGYNLIYSRIFIYAIVLLVIKVIIAEMISDLNPKILTT